MLGVGHGDGLATMGPPRESGGTLYTGSFGVGVGGLSPGRLSPFRVSARYQLLFGPATTPGGVVYHRLPGTPTSAFLTNELTAGEATNTPSEPRIIVWVLFSTSPTQMPTAMSGVNATVTASLKLSVVPV